MNRFRRQDIEIPMEVMEDLTSHTSTPLHVLTSRSAADVLTVDDGRSSSKHTPRLPSISTTPASQMTSSMPRMYDGRLSNRSQPPRVHRDKHLPYSVLRGYVFKQTDGGTPSLSDQMYSTPAQTYLSKREQRMRKEKHVQHRSRSECEHRDDDATKPSFRMLAFDGGKLIELPKIANNYCLIHNAGVECTCVRQRGDNARQRSNERMQDRETARYNNASRLSSQSWMDKHDREQVRTRVIEGLHSKEYLREKHVVTASGNYPPPPTSRMRKTPNRHYATTHDRPPNKCSSSRNYINTWLDAGAGTPRFVRELHHKK